MWDAKSYYRQYELDWPTVATHCRSWVGPDGPECLMDFRMMFGCREGANWAQRGTGLFVWLQQQAMDRVVPQSPVIRAAFKKLQDQGVPQDQWHTSYTSGYIDDQPSLCVESMTGTFTAVQAGLWTALQVEAQGKKVWHEGGFEPK